MSYSRTNIDFITGYLSASGSIKMTHAGYIEIAVVRKSEDAAICTALQQQFGGRVYTLKSGQTGWNITSPSCIPVLELLSQAPISSNRQRIAVIALKYLAWFAATRRRGLPWSKEHHQIKEQFKQRIKEQR